MASAIRADAYEVHPSSSSWNWLWRQILGAVVLAVLGVAYFGHDAEFAPLSMIELGLHESSHWATRVGPEVPYFMAGSVGQVLIPLLIGGYLAVVMRDPLGGAMGLGWAGLSCHGVAVYVADAPYEDLPLVGGDTHDWAFLLGPETWNRLDLAAPLAHVLRVGGASAVAAGVAWCLLVPALQVWRGRPGAPAGGRPLPRVLSPRVPRGDRAEPLGAAPVPVAAGPVPAAAHSRRIADDVLSRPPARRRRPPEGEGWIAPPGPHPRDPGGR